jgi:anti-sigma B factor antagonist
MGEQQEVAITTHVSGDAVVLEISGQVRELGAEELRDQFDAFLEEGQSRFILKLEGVSFISSVGLGQIMRAFRMASGAGGYVRIVKPQPLVEEVFRFTKLHTLVGIYDSVDEAAAAEV